MSEAGAGEEGTGPLGAGLRAWWGGQGGRAAESGWVAWVEEVAEDHSVCVHTCVKAHFCFRQSRKVNVEWGESHSIFSNL